MTRAGLARTATIGAGVLLGSSGAFMLFAPGLWYATVPGVPATGPFNGHFVIDVALAYLASAIGLVVAGVRTDRLLAGQAAAWPVAHAAFHLVLWMRHGLPAGPALPTEAVAVVGLSALAAVGVWMLPARGSIDP